MGERDSPAVFISYSHDSRDHCRRVLALTDQLRADGVNATIDQYSPAPAEGWARWMEARIREADFVLLVCTATYLRRMEGREKDGVGRGVIWEGNLIYQHVYESGTRNSTFIPVVLAGESASSIPIPLRGVTYYPLQEPFSLEEAGYEELYRRLTNQPKVLAPEVGKLRSLPAKDRRSGGGGGGDGANKQRDSARPHAGRMVAKMCDRRSQEAEFREAFRARQASGVPALVFLIPGELGQCHESLVQRLLCQIDYPQDSQERPVEQAGRPMKIAWQYEGSLDRRSSELVCSIFENFRPSFFGQGVSGERLTAARLDDLLQTPAGRYVAVQHDLFEAKWDKTTSGLIERYTTFWDKWERPAEKPVILVFVSIIYRQPSKGW